MMSPTILTRLGLATALALPSMLAAQQIDLSEVLRPQSRPATAPVQSSTPASETSAQPSQLVDIQPSGGTGPAAPAETSSAIPTVAPERFFPLRPSGTVPQEDGSVVLQGLSATQEFLWFLPEGEMPDALRLSWQTSVYALPEQSTLTVSLNGTEILNTPAQAISGMQAEDIPLPEGLARPGRNEVRVQANHTHRLRCDAQTAYELWTRIQPSQSGVDQADAAPATAAGADLLARIAAQTSLPFTYANGEPRIQPSDHRILSAIGRVVEGLPLDPVPVSASDPVTQPVQVVFGADIPTEVAVRARPDGGTSLLIASGASDEAIGRALGVSDFGRDNALFQLTPGEPVSLSAMGFRAAQISARQWESIVEFRLPEYWMAASTAKAILRIDYAHVAELPKGSQIQLEANGVPVWRLPLDFREARIRRGVPIYIDARHLSAGRNQLRFVSQVAAEDSAQACAPLGDELLVEVSAESTLSVPPSPQMFLPTLSRALERMGPTDITVQQSAMAGEAGLAPRIAALFPPATIDASAPTGLQVRAVNEVAGLSERDRLIHQIVAQTDLSAPTAAPATDPASYRFAIGEAESAPSFDNILQLSRSGRLEGMWLRARSLVLDEPAPEFAAWAGDVAPVAALYLPDGQAGPVMVHAPELRPEVVSIALWRARQTDAPLHGQVAFLLGNGEWSLWKDPTTEPILAEPVTAQNIFGVLSNLSGRYPHYFIGAMLAAAVVLAGLLTLIMGGLRRRDG